MRVLGIDIGGSKTHAVVVEDGRILAEVTVASANVASVGEPAAAAALDALAQEVGTTPVGAVCAGAAGADTAAGREWLAGLLRVRFPSAVVTVVHDSEIILAASGHARGVVVISGTGSAAWGRAADGAEARAGGWGYLLGDEGGGYVLARDAVRAVLAEADRAEPPGPLARDLLAACGLADPADLLDLFYARPERRYWASHAAVVCRLAEQGDAAAVLLLDGCADALAGLAGAVARRIDATGPVVLAGGLVVHQPALATRLAGRLAARGLGPIEVLRDPPAFGAARLATANHQHWRSHHA